MEQHIYWHAPLWEVLLAVSMSLALFAWLTMRLIRRPDLPSVLSAINPALNNQPLFFFDRLQGVICLSDAAERAVNNLPASRRQFLLDVLTETLVEAYEEARVTWQSDWPEPGYDLIAVPVFGQPGIVAGVLASTTIKPSLPLALRSIDLLTATDTKDWLVLGRALHLHRTRPLVRVRRITPTVAETTATWQVHRLGSKEEALLRYLLEHQGRVQTVEKLFSVVWPEDKVRSYGLSPDQKDRLRRLVYQLRQRVEPDPRNPRYVCTAHGIGYVLYSEREAAVP